MRGGGTVPFGDTAPAQTDPEAINIIPAENSLGGVAQNAAFYKVVGTARLFDLNSGKTSRPASNQNGNLRPLLRMCWALIHVPDTKPLTPADPPDLRPSAPNLIPYGAKTRQKARNSSHFVTNRPSLPVFADEKIARRQRLAPTCMAGHLGFRSPHGGDWSEKRHPRGKIRTGTRRAKIPGDTTALVSSAPDLFVPPVRRRPTVDTAGRTTGKVI